MSDLAGENNRCNFIAGQWVAGEVNALSHHDPATGAVAWMGRSASSAQLDRAVAAARGTFGAWAGTPRAQRIDRLNAFAQRLEQDADGLSMVISRETGKPRWESREEVAAMVAKIALSVRAAEERRRPSAFELGGGGVTAATRFKPHGVVAVLGPFNFPGHLPNGHIVPALLAGNTVVFKPSELAPGVAQRTVEHWEQAGLPAGVLNLVHGTRDVGAALARHPGIDGLFFTGSFAAGRAINQSLADVPHRILALEMGGNNPLVAWPPIGDVRAAVYAIVQSAFLTAGQRCSCARRLIVPADRWGDELIDALVTMTKNLRVGPHTSDPEPFMGPVISADAAAMLLNAQEALLRAGGNAILPMIPAAEIPSLLRPGIVDVTAVTVRPDVEHFGPFLQVIRTGSFDAALEEANHTAFGLVAALLCDDRVLYERFYGRARAGVINWNRPTTGASSRLPFGGIGQSGNHRPSGYWACDYCSYPVASLEVPVVSLPSCTMPGVPL